MLSFRLALEGAKGLLMLLLLREELRSLSSRGMDRLCRDLDREGDLEQESGLDCDKPVSANVLVRELDLEVPDMLNESPVR